MASEQQDADDRQDPDVIAWDRVGRFFEDMGRLGVDVWNRNLGVWNEVARNLRKPKYTADAMTDDASKVLAAALDNVDDIWTYVTRVPERQQVASALPTAFLFFAKQEGAPRSHALADTVWIRLARRDLEGLPNHAEIEVTGPEAGAEALRKCLRATRGATGYRLESAAAADLQAGLYGGFVYVTSPQPRPLANLRVAVQG